MKIGKREKLYLIVIPILFVVLVMKSYLFDEYKATNFEEANVIKGIYQTVDEKYDGFVYDNNILSFRVVAIKIIKEEDGVKLYKSKVRKYLFTVIPYRDLIIEYRFNTK
ncbi:hypothetical protein [Helicovermis profundi]|uniref:Uncharacterized protein n=1 Tax=Helicovermis profundi TaxID=3065157 RepID=A0AAU9E9J1_9FIRM|nr:hypothetical protein HLPR_24790 [Clostridia bacterium S502]